MTFSKEIIHGKMTFSKEIIHKKLIFSKEIIFSGQGTGHCPALSINDDWLFASSSSYASSSHIIYFQRCSSSYASSSQAHQATQVLHTLYIFSGVHQAMQVHYAIWPIFIMVFGQYYKSEVKIIFPYLLLSHLQTRCPPGQCARHQGQSLQSSIFNFQLSNRI